MTSQSPQISVIMSVYNGEAYLRPAIDSILNQTFRDWELVVIDDCSTDSTPRILSQYALLDSRIRPVRNEVNLRLPRSLNKAISLARGKYVARMDADDISLPNRLSSQFAFMESHPEYALSSCKYMTLKNGAVEMGCCSRRGDPEIMAAMLLFTNPLIHPGVIARREIMLDNPYDPSHTCTEDLNLWCRLASAGHRLALQDDYLLLYRLHDKQITATTLDRQKEEVLRIFRPYYAAMLGEVPEKKLILFRDEIYFHGQGNVDRFCRYIRLLRSLRREKNRIASQALEYAAFEAFAEIRRQGIRRDQLLQGLSLFSPLFLIPEFISRKRRSQADIRRAVTAAESFGLIRADSSSSGTLPAFRLPQESGSIIM